MDLANQNLLNCFNQSVGCDLTFDDQDRTDSLFGIANITGGAVTSATFANWMRCRPNRPGRCAPGTIAASASRDALMLGLSTAGAVTAMNTTRGLTLVLPVFSDFASSKYDLVGFSAFVITTPSFVGTVGSGNWQPDNAQCGASVGAPCKVIHGYFTQYNLPALFKNAQSGASGTTDHGVRGVGLTN